MISKDRLIYDPADAAESDKVGAYLLSATGEEITHTTAGAKEALDVYLAGFSASSLGLFAEDSAHASGDVGQFVLAVQTSAQGALAADGDYAPLQVDGSGRLRTITDIDLVGDLVGDDEVDSEDPLKIGSRAVSGALAAVSASGDKANVISDLYRRVWVNTAPNIGNLAQEITVGATAVALPTTALAGRRKLYIKNVSNSDVYLGDSGVTVAQGFPLVKGAVLVEDFGPNTGIYAIAAGAGNAIRVWEVA